MYTILVEYTRVYHSLYHGKHIHSYYYLITILLLATIFLVRYCMPDIVLCVFLLADLKLW